MSRAKEFFVAVPFLCKAKNAARWSRLNAMQFDYEMQGKTLFDRNVEDIETPFNRLETAFGFCAFEHDAKRAAYCKLLGEIFVLAHYEKAHGETQHSERMQALVEDAKRLEGVFEDIDMAFSLEEAKSNEGWL